MEEEMGSASGGGGEESTDEIKAAGHATRKEMK
jgi:hypothetical protein